MISNMEHLGVYLFLRVQRFGVENYGLESWKDSTTEEFWFGDLKILMCVSFVEKFKL